MTPLSEVAADVAQALGLEPDRDQAEEAGMIVGWWTEGRLPWDNDTYLSISGLELTFPNWRCRCEDWLLQNNWVVTLAYNSFATHREYESVVVASCPWPEAPARLVSAVWRRQQEKKGEMP